MAQNSTIPADHARHDRLLVVRYLDRDDDLLASEVGQARALVANCSDCAALAVELQAIAEATNRMVLPARPRDFRITPQQAAALRPDGFRRFVQNVVAAFHFEFLRPLAGAAIAIGLLLAVVGSFPMLRGTQSPTADQSIRGAAIGGVSGHESTPGPFNAAPSTPGIETAIGTPASADAGLTLLPQVALEPTAPPPAGTTKNDASPRASHGTNPYGPAAATTARPVPAPSGDAAAVDVNATAAPAAPQVQNNSSAGAVGGADQPADAIPPLVILGALLAAVGLIVIVLTYASRRIGRSTL